MHFNILIATKHAHKHIPLPLIYAKSVHGRRDITSHLISAYLDIAVHCSRIDAQDATDGNIVLDMKLRVTDS